LLILFGGTEAGKPHGCHHRVFLTGATRNLFVINLTSLAFIIVAGILLILARDDRSAAVSGEAKLPQFSPFFLQSLSFRFFLSLLPHFRLILSEMSGGIHSDRRLCFTLPLQFVHFQAVLYLSTLCHHKQQTRKRRLLLAPDPPSNVEHALKTLVVVDLGQGMMTDGRNQDENHHNKSGVRRLPLM
jgi:hypothetical protein